MTTPFDTRPDSAVVDDIDCAVRAWLATPCSAQSQQWLTEQVWDIIDGPASSRTSEAAKEYAIKALLHVYSYNLEHDLALYGKNGSVAAEFLKNDRWKLLISAESYYFLATVLISCDPLYDLVLTKGARRVVHAWTNAQLPECIDKHKKDVARILFGDIWLHLYEDDLEGSPAQVYRLLQHVAPKLAFFKAEAVKKANVPSLPDDVAPFG